VRPRAAAAANWAAAAAEPSRAATSRAAAAGGGCGAQPGGDQPGGDQPGGGGGGTLLGSPATAARARTGGQGGASRAVKRKAASVDELFNKKTKVRSF